MIIPEINSLQRNKIDAIFFSSSVFIDVSLEIEEMSLEEQSKIQTPPDIVHRNNILPQQTFHVSYEAEICTIMQTVR